VGVLGGTAIDSHKEGLEPEVSEANRSGGTGVWRKCRVVWKAEDDLMRDSAAWTAVLRRLWRVDGDRNGLEHGCSLGQYYLDRTSSGTAAKATAPAGTASSSPLHDGRLSRVTSYCQKNQSVRLHIRNEVALTAHADVLTHSSRPGSSMVRRQELLASR
jgi:hypothetical protein